MYGVCKEKCKKWLLKEHPESFAVHYPEEAAAVKESADAEGLAVDVEKLEIDDESKHQTRGIHNFSLSFLFCTGGKALKRDASTAAEKEAAKRAKAKIVIHIAERNRRKAITYIKGLEAFGTQ